MPQGGQDWEGRHLLETDTVLTAGIDGSKSQCPSAGPTGDISPLSDDFYKSRETWYSSSSVFSWLFHCHWAGLGACPCEALCCPPPCCRLRPPAEPPSEASLLLDPGVFRSAQSAAARHALNRQMWSLSCSVQRQNAAFFLFQELKAGCRKSCWDLVVRLLGRASPVPHHTVLGGPFSTVTCQQVLWGLKAPTGIIHGVLNIFASCQNHLALASPSPIRTNPCVPQPLILWEDTDNLWIGLFLPPGSGENTSYKWKWRKWDENFEFVTRYRVIFAYFCQVSWDMRKYHKESFPCRSCAYPMICISFPISLMLLLTSYYQRASKETSRAQLLYSLEFQWKDYLWVSRNCQRRFKNHWGFLFTVF